MTFFSNYLKTIDLSVASYFEMERAVCTICSMMKGKVTTLDGLKQFLGQINSEDAATLARLLSRYVPSAQTATREYALLFAYHIELNNPMCLFPTHSDATIVYNAIHAALRNMMPEFDCALFFLLASESEEHPLLSTLHDDQKKAYYKKVLQQIVSPSDRKALLSLAKFVVDYNLLLLVNNAHVKTFFHLRYHLTLFHRMHKVLINASKESVDALHLALVNNFRLYTWCQLKDIQHRCLGDGAARLFADCSSLPANFRVEHLESLPRVVGNIVNGEWALIKQPVIRVDDVSALEKLLMGEPKSPEFYEFLLRCAAISSVGSSLNLFAKHYLTAVDQNHAANNYLQQEWPNSLLHAFLPIADDKPKLALANDNSNDDDNNATASLPVLLKQGERPRRVLKKRRRLRRQVFAKPIVADNLFNYRLHTHGFMILQNVFETSDKLVEELYRQVRAQSTLVFNNDDRTGDDNDDKRHQISLDTTAAVVRDMDRMIKQELQSRFPHHSIEERVVLHSMRGCRIQPAHTDFSIIARCEDSLFPFGALAAVEPGSKLIVWPRSIRIQTMDSSVLEGIEPIDPVIIHIPPESVVIFRGDCFHCGADYDKDNVRVHYYGDSPEVSRKDNQTWLLHLYGNGKDDEDLIRLIRLVAP